MGKKLASSLPAAVMAISCTHVLCCGLPAALSVLNLAAGLGIVIALPGNLVNLHTLLHSYELPIVGVSGLLLLLGWAMHSATYSMACDSHCHHEPCPITKRKNRNLLIAATVLFAINLFLFLREMLF